MVKHCLLVVIRDPVSTDPLVIVQVFRDPVSLHKMRMKELLNGFRNSCYERRIPSSTQPASSSYQNTPSQTQCPSSQPMPSTWRRSHIGRIYDPSTHLTSPQHESHQEIPLEPRAHAASDTAELYIEVHTDTSCQKASFPHEGTDMHARNSSFPTYMVAWACHQT